jgi:hypothetical protein
MGKLSFIAGLATGYVLGAKAGRHRYEQIRATSGKVWNSQPVQKQVESAKEVAKTKAAPVVADMVADAARATGEKLRQGKTIASEAVSNNDTDKAEANGASSPSAGSDSEDRAATQGHSEAWSAATKPTSAPD